jgi:benzoylformate decarboxylase
MVGDGSAMYSPQALWSAVHENAPVVYVVLNNLEYGILKNFMVSQTQYNSNQHGFLAMDLCQPKVDFPSLAKSMGVESTVVSSHREISGAVEAAIKAGKPHLIEIPVKGIGGAVRV